MKKIFLIAAFLESPLWAYHVPQLEYQVAISSATTNIVNISSFNAAGSTNQADTPTLAGRVTLEIQNLDGSANLWCRPDTGVSSTNGRKIAPGNSWIVSFSDQFLSPGVFQGGTPTHIYCLNDGGSGTTKAAVTQAY